MASIAKPGTACNVRLVNKTSKQDLVNNQMVVVVVSKMNPHVYQLHTEYEEKVMS